MTNQSIVPYHPQHPKRVARSELAKNMAVEYITEPEYVQLYHAAKHPEYKLLIRLLWETGLRISEALALFYSDIYPDGINVLHGKGDKQRIVHTQAPILGELLRYARGHERESIFQKIRTRQAANYMLKRTAKSAGIFKNIHNHLFRHSYAINFLKQTGNPFALQAQGGWSDMETIKIYMRMASQMPAEAVAVMHFPDLST
jgi:site-specific recombinase XerD